MSLLNNSLFVDFLAILFGLGSWVTINGVWVQLTQLVLHLPEGWKLPSYLAIIIQLANIGPLIYALLRYFFTSRLTDVISVTVTSIIGSMSCLLLSFFWKETVYLSGQLRSVPLFVLVFLMATVDCTSSVLFLPFMGLFKDKHLTSYLVGEGLSGFLPSALALTQGVGGNPECRNVTVKDDDNGTNWMLEPYYEEPRFTAGEFFFLLFVMDILSLTAFFVLNYIAQKKLERNKIDEPVLIELQLTNSVMADIHITTNDGEREQNEETEPLPSSGPRIKYYLYILQAWLCALSNGVFTSVQSYSGLQYGNNVFHLCVLFSTMANPLACCVAFILPTKNLFVISAVAGSGTAISCYLMATAVLSPEPPLLGTTVGEILLVTSWILFSGLFSYAKVCVASILRNHGRVSLFWCGVWTQIGSAVGAAIMFVLINIYNLFESFYPC